MFADSILSGRNSFLGVSHRGNRNTGEGKGLTCKYVIRFCLGKTKRDLSKVRNQYWLYWDQVLHLSHENICSEMHYYRNISFE